MAARPRAMSIVAAMAVHCPTGRSRALNVGLEDFTMYGSLRRRAAVAMLASSLLLAAPLAAAPVAASDLTFPAGVACSFELAVDVGDGGPQHYREFTDRAGQVLRWISAGRGNDLTFTNVSTGATLSLDATGAVQAAANHPDGTMTLTMIGQNVLILFPSDVPAGPSTTLQVGRVVVDIDSGGNFVVKSVSGITMDICAALT